MKNIFLVIAISIAFWIVGCEKGSVDLPTEPETPETYNITLDKKEINMVVGDKTKLTATYTSTSNTNEIIKWTSSNLDVVKVSGNGEVEAVGEGISEIRASVKDVYDVCIVTVDKKTIPISDIIIKNDVKRLKIDEAYKIEFSIVPIDATSDEITFSSSNSQVASVNENGEVVGKSVGNAVIKLSAGGVAKDVKVSVFQEDEVYAATMYYDYNKYVSQLWKYDTEILSYANFQIVNFDVRENNTLIIGNEDYDKLSAVIIKNGNKTQLEDIDYGERVAIIDSEFDGDDIYLLVNYPKPVVNGGHGVWKNSKKLFEYAEDAVLTEYSIINIYDILVIESDVYACGCIVEPVDETNSEYIPTIWKNNKIYKQYKKSQYNVGDYSYIGDMVLHNGQIHMLMSEGSNNDCKLSVWSENGKLYELENAKVYNDGELHNITGGNIYSNNGDLYCAVSRSYNNNEIYSFVLSAYRNQSEIFTIPDVYLFSVDFVEDSMYSLVTKQITKGGNIFWSESIYRDDVEVVEIIKPQSYHLYSPSIKAYSK